MYGPDAHTAIGTGTVSNLKYNFIPENISPTDTHSVRCGVECFLCARFSSVAALSMCHNVIKMLI